MRLKCSLNFPSGVRVRGTDYLPDAKGIYDVPDNDAYVLLQSSIWAEAAGKPATFEAEKEPESLPLDSFSPSPSPAPAPAPAAAPPKPTTKRK